MKIGIVADVHANLHALTQVLDELDDFHGVDLTICAGDLVCYGAHPNEVIDLLRQRSVACVCGNYDDAVAWGRPVASRRPSSPGTEPLKRAALAWTKARMAPWQRDYLRSLPWAQEHRLDGLRILVLHAGPGSLDEPLDPSEPEAMALLTTHIEADVIIVGHTHHAYTYIARNTLVVNPGAVGRSLDGDVTASYAVLDTQSGVATIHRTPYDLDGAVAAIERSGMPVEIAALVRYGLRRLEELPL